jgi:hypothetical protein
MSGQVTPVAPLDAGEPGGDVGRNREAGGRRRRDVPRDAPSLALSPEDEREISAILRRSAEASYLGVGDVEVRSRAGEIVVRARVFEPEEEYE